MKKFVAFALAAVFMTLTAVAAFAQPEVVVHHKINPHSQSPNNIGESATTGGTGTLTPLNYAGGSLIGTPVIYIIWYGNWSQTNGSDTSAGQQIVRDFSNSIGGSPYFNLNTYLSAGGQTITGNVISSGETTDAYSQGKRLRDSGVLAVVNNAINTGKLPYDANGVYFVLTSSDVAESSGFCTQYCGWHTSAARTEGRLRYSFVGNANRCLSSCAAQTVSPNGNAGVDGMISVVAHELEEATTDADPRSGWSDSSGAENADKCAWTFGHNQKQTATGAWYNMTLGSRNYLIQRNILKSGSDFLCMVDSTQN
ncbi:MAG: EXORDIUM family protein [Acidobacteriota bacterium]|nr:EXORDIUM family protein [Acidobacteriota bacterium]